MTTRMPPCRRFSALPEPETLVMEKFGARRSMPLLAYARANGTLTRFDYTRYPIIAITYSILGVPSLKKKEERNFQNRKRLTRMTREGPGKPLHRMLRREP